MRFEIPDQKKLTNEAVIPIRWGDMDAMGHVNNTVYFRYLEIVRIAWFDLIGCAPDPKGEGPVIVNAFCNFQKQIEYPGSLLVKHFVCNPGRTSIDSYTTIERTDQPGLVYASGGATIVWTNFPAQKSAPLPDWLRAIVA